MSAFDPSQFQVAPNGPLSRKTIDRLIAIRQTTGMSYATLANKLGFSGTFPHHLINRNANVRTQHIQRIISAIETLENPDAGGHDSDATTGTLRHSFHLRQTLQVVIELPAYLTEREAERLARFVQSLPVA